MSYEEDIQQNLQTYRWRNQQTSIEKYAPTIYWVQQRKYDLFNASSFFCSTPCSDQQN